MYHATGGAALVTFLAFAVPASAQSLTTDTNAIWYLGSSAGWTRLDNERSFANSLGEWQDGFNIGVRAGIEWGFWRVEEELRFLRNNGKFCVAVPSAVCSSALGNRRAYAIMTNVLYDFQLSGPVTPHIGGGIGAASLNDSVRIPGLGTFVDNQEWGFAYQGIVGIRYNLSPAVAVDLDYKFLGTTSTQIRTTSGIPTLPITYNTDFSSHSIVASLSIRLNPPISSTATQSEPEQSSPPPVPDGRPNPGPKRK